MIALTKREKQIWYLLGENYSRSEAANYLDISPKTVMRHLVNANRKLGIKSPRGNPYLNDRPRNNGKFMKKEI